jgi:reversibly glycosylated polypeptide / UDP-arabinopyranose mutase
MIAVVVPTVRPEKYAQFLEAWSDLFELHQVALYKVEDGDVPRVNGLTAKQVMGKDADLIYNRNDGVRNLGFYKAIRDGAEVIITLDDDVRPIGDPIQDHLNALDSRFPISWMNTVDEAYMRGFPYGIREEAECVLSHGAWTGVADFDASTQLVLGTPEVTPRRMPIPKGILYPMCIMNTAFKRKMAPFMYQAPMFGDVNRFADIWSGIEAKKKIDEMGWCAVTGYATVLHERASNPFVNLVKEAKGVGMNEEYGKDEYFRLYDEKRDRWIKAISDLCEGE